MCVAIFLVVGYINMKKCHILLVGRSTKGWVQCVRLRESGTQALSFFPGQSFSNIVYDISGTKWILTRGQLSELFRINFI